jgi:hypothetical protein
MDAAQDPIRAEVERALHQAVGALLGVPLAVGRRMQRCLTAGAARVTAPVEVVRSFADVAVGRVVSPVEADIASPRPGPPPDPDATVPVERRRQERTAAGPRQPAARRRRPSRAADVAADPDPVALDDSARADEADGDAGDLPIEQYESLAASHVVARLEALTTDELHTVRNFETAHRGRRTVLGKIDQLLASAGE